MVATSFHDASSNAAPVLMVRGPGRADAEREYGEVRLYPTRMRFVTGVARAYEDDFPTELSHLVKETDFDIAINQINNTMQDYWPCFFCIFCGYGCCPCTLGLSLFCPNFCIRDAEQYVRALLSRINKRVCFERVGVEWRLVRSCGRSWIQITYPLAPKKPPLVTYQNGILPSSTPLVPPNDNHPESQETPSSSSALSAATPLVP
ncbi:Golgin subfamily A member 7/ERF4 [Phytophthora cinnamomi]|uniref:Golgin subfamily A member 7/ERF4 n=1 Tax=Phytophthora cinnamomi TaxID=4785 RepID=UPI00355A211B|nr:Golgin subfamily A member 7/ERF4 [Phytophthora cinnamomi]